MMKSIIITTLLAGVSVAHSGVWKLTVDGVEYPAFDTRMDGKLGAKRIEWSFKDNGVPWAPIEKVNDAAITCGVAPRRPALKAYARAGSKITVTWSGIIRTHYGPIMSYLAPLPDPNMAPQNLSFFKIEGQGYDQKAKLWANEEVIATDRQDTMQIPSDIKSGTYVFRTELLALHFASKTGPQFYPHCFNIEITGDGTASPPGVKFPGGYKPSDPSLIYPLFKNGAQNNWATYVVPGPPKYNGQYKAPIGEPRAVTDRERGVFPAEFQVKYDAFKKKEDAEGLSFNQKINDAQAYLQHNEVSAASERKLGPLFQEHFKAQKGFDRELQDLKREALKLGIAE